MTAGLFAPLTRAELDRLIDEAQHADARAHVRLVNAPLDQDGAVAAAAGVAVDCLEFCRDAREESLMRMLEGEMR